MESKDVIIVGGGPVGLYLASLLKGDVLVLERSPLVGNKADSGLYSTNLDNFLEIDEKCVEHRVTGAVLHSKNETIEVRKSTTAAYVADRQKFTAALYEKVKDKVLLQAAVKEIKIKDKVAVETNKGRFESKLLVGCDGASSIVRKHFGIQPKELLNGIIGITNEEDHSPQVDLYFDKSLINDGFFWKIPRGATTEYGALGKNVNFPLLEKFFKIKNYEKRAAPLNLGLFQTAFPRTILLGDAAGQVKPWSAGGIVYGFTCAQIAAKILGEALEKNDFSEQFLKTYDQEWKKKIGGPIRTGLLFRDLFIKMDNPKLDSTFRILRKLPLSKMDMDFPDFGQFL